LEHILDGGGAVSGQGVEAARQKSSDGLGFLGEDGGYDLGKS
jgi:hypothetical protein